LSQAGLDRNYGEMRPVSSENRERERERAIIIERNGVRPSVVRR